MWVVYVFGVLFVINIIIIMLYVRTIIVTKKANKEYEQKLLAEGFKADKRIIYKDLALFVDSKNKNWSIKENNKSCIQIYRFSDLIQFTVNENGKKVESSSRGAIAGTLMFGVIGSELLGAGKGYTQCKHLNIIIKVNDSESSKKTLHLLKKPTGQGSPDYNKAIKAAEKIAEALANIEKFTSAT